MQVSSVNEKIQSPGQLLTHYSPHTRLILVDPEKPIPSTGKKTGYLAFRKPPQESFDIVKVLSPSGDLKEAAANLFKMLHELDESAVDVILAEKIPEEGLGLAIMDRLRKAEHK